MSTATKTNPLLKKLPSLLASTAQSSRRTTTFSLQPTILSGVTAHAPGMPEEEVSHPTSGSGPRSSIKDIPGPRSIPGLGAMWQYLPGGRYHKLDLNDAIRNMNSLYGDVVREEIVPGLNLIRLYNPKDFADVYRAEGESPERVLFGLLSHYNDVYNEGVQGLLTSQNYEWKKLRSNVQQQLLQPKPVLGYAKDHVGSANDFVEHIARKKDAEGNIHNMLPEIYKYVTEAVATVCFDRKLGLLDKTDTREGRRFITAVGESLRLTQKELQLLPLYRHIPTPVFAQFTRAQNIIREVSNEQMEKAIASSGRLVTHLLLSSDLTMREISTFLSEFFAAGVDTTGHYLAFALYALARNARVQDVLYNEIKDVTDDDVTSGALESTPYLRAFLKESLRVYPVAPGLGRTLQKDAVIAGYEIPAKTNIVLQYDLAGKDSRFISDPEDFLPERWLRGNRENVHPYMTLPFGFGPRSCPGKRLASQEVAIAITKILQRYHVSYNGGDMSLKMHVLNTPDRKLSYKFTPRIK